MSAGAVPSPAAPANDELLDSAAASQATVRGSALRTAGYGLSVLLSVISAPLLVRHLGIVQFGRYMTAISLVALAGGVSDAGLTSIAVREWTTRRGEEREQHMRDLLGLRLVLAVLGVAAVTLFAVAAGYGTDLVLGTLLAGGGMVVLVMQTAYSVPLQTELRLGLVTAADVLRQAVTVALIAAFVLVLALGGVVPFLAIPLLASGLPLLLTVAAVRRGFPLAPAFRVRAWRALVRDTLPVAAAVALHHVYLRIVIVVMSLLAVELQTGYFATSFRVTEVLIAVPFLLAQTTLPVLSRAAQTDLRRLAGAVQRVFETSAVLGVGTALCVVAGAPLAIRLLAGTGAGEAAAVLRLQSIAMLLVFLTVTWQNALFALRDHRGLVVSNAVGLGVTTGMTLVLVPVLQARGAAIGAAVGELALTLTSAALLVRGRGGMTLSLAFAPRLLVAAAVAALVLAIPGIPDVVRVLGVGAGYLAALAALGAIPAEVRTALVEGPLASLRRR